MPKNKLQSIKTEGDREREKKKVVATQLSYMEEEVKMIKYVICLIKLTLLCYTQKKNNVYKDETLIGFSLLF